MSRIAAVSLLRQCTASVSAPALARHSARAGLRPPFAAIRAASGSGTRLYSTQQNGQNGQNGAEEKKVNGEPAEQKVDEIRKEENAPSAQTESEDAAHSECQKKLKAKEDEAVDLTSRLRYLQADFLNLQRNAAREKEQTRDFAITRFAGDLLETVDVLSLALKSVPESALKPAENGSGDVPASTSASAQDSEASTSSTSAAMSDSSSSTSPSQPAQPPKSATEYLRDLHHGVEMTHRLLLQTLFKYGVKPFDPTGDPFNPNKHEALYSVPIPGKKPGTVVDCQKTGYTIKERTLRAAQVGVASEGGGTEPPVREAGEGETAGQS